MKMSSPLTGKYLVKNKYLYLFLKMVDFVSSFFVLSKKKKKVTNPKKILISNIAHLGDVVIALSVLPIIKNKFPKSKIGFLCSSTSQELLHQHPMIDNIHILDHWKLNRSNILIYKKMLQYLITRAKAINEIRKEKYEVAIDLYSYFPNSIYLFGRAKIKNIVGYTSGGFQNFLTRSIDWKNQDKHISSYHFDLLKLLGITNKNKINVEIDSSLFVDEKFKVDLPDDFVLFHIGAGDAKKMWNINKWKRLTKRVKDKTIIFTGKGSYENQQILEIINDQKKCINFCDKLNLQEMIYVINKAKFVVCVDSVVSHISTALNKPTAIIFCGINNHHHWVLKKDNVFPVFKNLPCNPCYEKNGCETMDCLNQIKIDDVLSKMESFFEKAN